MPAMWQSRCAAADPVVIEALDIVAHDSVFIGAKIHRAPIGRSRSPTI